MGTRRRLSLGLGGGGAPGRGRQRGARPLLLLGLLLLVLLGLGLLGLGLLLVVLLLPPLVPLVSGLPLVPLAVPALGSPLRGGRWGCAAIALAESGLLPSQGRRRCSSYPSDGPPGSVAAGSCPGRGGHSPLVPALPSLALVPPAGGRLGRGRLRQEV